MRQAPRSPLSFKLQRVANVPEHPPPSTRLMSCAHIANRQLSRIIGVSKCEAYNRVYGAILRNELRSSYRFSAVGAGPRLKRCGGVKPQLRVRVEQKPRLPC